MSEDNQVPEGMNPQDFERLAAFIEQAKAAMAAMPADATAGVNWQMATSQAREIAAKGSSPISDASRQLIQNAEKIGALWLNDATAFSGLTSESKLLSRELWVADAMPLMQSLAEPVANRMSAALSEHLEQNMPEELSALLGNTSNFMRAAGGTLFAMQLGQALGKLSTEVLSGGDIGLPLFKDQRAAFVPQNLAAFVSGLEIETDQPYIYLVIREMAHVRLFKHSKWLREAVISQITKYAADISIDNSRISEFAEDFDPSNTEEIQQALESGAFIAERSDEQNAALANIETTLALIEGWVDVVTENATKLLPHAAAIAEAVRRRRATGGPAEQTFGTLVGLELRPRRLREASAMWRQVGDALGIDKRDSLWDHPDLMPTAEDIVNPAKLIAKLRGENIQSDDFDQALRDLLGE